jgi:hypothetical protein
MRQMLQADETTANSYTQDSQRPPLAFRWSSRIVERNNRDGLITL